MNEARELEVYIGGLIIGQGRHAGQPFKLLHWQRSFLRGAFSQEDTASLTLGRGGGKTTLIAAIACATVDVDGPLVEPGAESLVVASSFDQGLLSFRHVQRFMEPSFEKYGVGGRGRFRVQDSANRATIEDKKTGAMLRVVGSDPRRLHGAAPRILIEDELAQWPPTLIDRMLAALETSLGKIPGSRVLQIGTRPATVDHPFAKALAGSSGYVQVHAAGEADPPFQRRTWKKANPGLDHFPDLEAQIRKEAVRARQDPDALATFKALRLNMGVSDVVESLLLGPETWERIQAKEPVERSGKYALGLDLGSTSAFSAAAAFHPASGAAECFGVLPHSPGLGEKGMADGVGRLYIRMHQRGEVLLAGEYVSDIAELLREVLRRWGPPACISCDRFKEGELREQLAAVNFPRVPLILRGQGFRDGAEDVRGFRKAALSGRVRPALSLLLTSAFAEAKCIHDPAGNAKLAKGHEGGRRLRSKDDAAAALILAVAEGERRATGQEQKDESTSIMQVV